MPSRIYLITRFLEAAKSPFAVSRLIMMSGVPIRDLGPTAHDDPHQLAKVEASVAALLNAEERRELERYLREHEKKEVGA